VTPAGEATVAKLTSLVVKVGALLFILFAPVQYALDLQLLGGLWILQIFPAVVFGLYFHWFRGPSLLLGWLAGFACGSYLSWINGLKPLHTLVIGGASYSVYIGLIAVVLNIVVATLANLILPSRRPVLMAEVGG
jgi:SSS family solute:Na+ symporter